MKKNSEKTGDTDDDVKKDDEEQSKRFIEKAMELELTEKSGNIFKKIRLNKNNDKTL